MRCSDNPHNRCSLSLTDANDDSGWSYTQTALAGGKLLLLLPLAVQW